MNFYCNDSRNQSTSIAKNTSKNCKHVETQNVEVFTPKIFLGDSKGKKI